jgi:hypothetical protein
VDDDAGTAEPGAAGQVVGDRGDRLLDVNDGTPRSAQPSTNSASCFGSPAVSFQPRGLPTNTWTARAPTASV